MSAARCSLSVLLFACAAAVFAAVPAEALTLPEAYRSALARHDRILLARQDLRRVELGRDQARAQLLPRLTVEGQYTRRPEALFGPSFDGGAFLLRSREEESLQLILEQPLYTGGRASATLARATKAIEASRALLAMTEDELLFRVAEAYYRVLKAEHAVEVAMRQIERLAVHRRAASVRFSVGDVTRTAVLRIEAELESARAQQVSARAELMVARETLAELARVSPEASLEPPPPLTAPSLAVDPVALALDGRVDLRRRRVVERMADDEVLVARGAFLPLLTVEGTYSWRGAAPTSPFFIDQEATGVVKFSLPLFEGGLRVAALREARVKRRQAELDRLSLEAMVRVEVKEARWTFEALEASVVHLERQHSFAKENRELVSKQFAAGLVSTVELLDAEVLLREAEQRVAAARYDRDLAILRLQWRLGLLRQFVSLE